MGLDQRAWAVEQCDNSKEGKFKELQIGEWRKHNRLQGWMEDLWVAKGNDIRGFNQTSMPLTMEDIEKLEQDINKMALPATEGFFYGGDSYTDPSPARNYYYEKEDREFVRQAKFYLEQGKEVWYWCWW